MDRQELRLHLPAGNRSGFDGALDWFPYEAVLSIWKGIEENWMSLVTSWNLNGVRWREFSLAEIIWMVHTTALEHMKQENPGGVRLYLTQVRDYTALREWDTSRMKDSSDR